MYAIVETSGKQFRVEEGSKLIVDRMNHVQVGDQITLDRVLMLGGGSFVAGSPVVEGAKVSATVLEHGRGEKVLVFKKRRRQDSRKMRGHRQDYTSLKITAITA